MKQHAHARVRAYVHTHNTRTHAHVSARTHTHAHVCAHTLKERSVVHVNPDGLNQNESKDT